MPHVVGLFLVRPVLGRSQPQLLLELPHEVDLACVAAHFCNFFDRDIGSGKQVFRMFYPAGNDVRHRAHPEEVLIQMLKTRSAHGQLMG